MPASVSASSCLPYLSAWCSLQFTRSTTKYWVHPSNILRLKLALTKQLPLLVYGADDPVSSGDITAVAAEGADGAEATTANQHKVTSLVSSGMCEHA
jgi:SPX domain protein involved in polyphosphate accumulation